MRGMVEFLNSNLSLAMVFVHPNLTNEGGG